MFPHEVADSIDEYQVLDVREPFEWAAGRIPSATHIPMGDLNARVEDLREDGPILCVCRSGARSAMVVHALRNAGYEAHNLDGGMQAWAVAGLPMEADDGAPRVA